ncbi:MAG: flagellar basal body protein [Planctomycetota bacterium]|jgi:flagellar hook protein FlgE|nr:flagellar basal body protein [Planctomycetota bacterium]
MAINGLGTSLSALQANQFRQDVTANNIANVNTDGFRASTVQTSDAAYINDIGQGTQVSGTYAPPRPGPIAMDAASATGGMVEQSNTDVVTETTNRMGAQHAYGANIAMARTTDEMMQTLMDMRA